MKLFFILQIIYFLLPAAAANIAPVIVRNYFKFLAYPIDFYKKINGKRIFGDHKTFRGFIFGILAAMIVVMIQAVLFNEFVFFNKLFLMENDLINVWLFGFLIGFGTLFGDLAGAFIKRRFNFKPGKSLFILDQANNIIGIAIFVTPFYFDSWTINLWFLLIWFIGHLVIKYLGYLLKINKEKI